MSAGSGTGAVGLANDVQASREVPSRADTFGSPRWALIAVSGLLLGALPLAISNRFYLHLLVVVLMYGALNVTWNLVLGVAGILSFAHLAFFAIGGYSSAILVMNVGVSPVLGTLAGGAAAGIGGLAVGALSLRTRGIYVLLLTWAFAEIMRTLILADGSGLTGASRGLTGVPGYFPESFTAVSTLRLSYLVALAMFLLVAVIVFRLIHSSVGLALESLRDSETYAAARGVSRFRYHLVVFAATAAMAGFVGAYYVHYLGTITPSVLGFGLMANLLAMIVVGGWGTFAGPIVGTVLLVALTEMLRGLEQLRLVLIGLLVALVLLVQPRGLVGLSVTAWPRIRRFTLDLLKD